MPPSRAPLPPPPAALAREVLALLPVQPEHLKTSGLGKSVMTMLRHPDETQENKLAAKRLVEQWSRPIIGRSIDLRAHEKRHDSGPRDVVAEMRDRQGKDNMDECVVFEAIAARAAGRGVGGGTAAHLSTVCSSSLSWDAARSGRCASFVTCRLS